jgi:4'-phosphopantetheinyl transferase
VIPVDEKARPARRGAPVVVDVWWASLDQPAAVGAWLGGQCSSAERARAARMYDPEQARRWLTGRGIVRTLLAQRLAIPATEVAVLASPSGKPRVDGPVNFNLSHSCGHLYLAMTDGPEVGIDVQAIDESIDVDAIARCFFTPGERSVLDAEPAAADRARSFFRLWALKEAWLKASGTGLSVPMSEADVVPTTADLPAPGPAQWCPRGADAAPLWTASGFALVELPAPVGYVGALALHERVPAVRSHRWEAPGAAGPS